jgi:hypothetical protein
MNHALQRQTAIPPSYYLLYSVQSQPKSTVVRLPESGTNLPSPGLMSPTISLASISISIPIPIQPAVRNEEFVPGEKK